MEAAKSQLDLMHDNHVIKLAWSFLALKETRTICVIQCHLQTFNVS